ncbi:hypothetical protein L207DRAFT_637477 [Hyaloscypha variabilis F]|uniref:Cora-domain-containing protein n=1 Tax=Hyaloscypha variabilis (strain UAMH 11265 / GT02V1 / F) TaxID=1149755 RepID=A0A2J6RCX3_HYAVF|nr:hypothetical protein L207DRAFT_637477 [Hyaloscypha variabilis F]
MEKLMLKRNLQRCKFVTEATTYLEMFSYSDPSLDTVEEHPLISDEFENFLERKGVFAERILPDGVSLLAGLRLILQKDAKHPETFTPHVISLEPETYSKMIHGLHFPMRAIESTSYVGPFFWAGVDQNDENTHLQVVQRKSDVRKKGYTRGWELMLSYDFRTGLMAGFCKGTPSSHIVESIKSLKACCREICHPLLLPMILFSHDAPSDIKQRDARDWLRKLEHAIAMRPDSEEGGYMKDGVVNLDMVNRDLVQCHAQVLWQRPISYLRIIDSFKEALELFYNNIPENKRYPETEKIQISMLSRLEFYRKKWQGIETYANTTLERLATQKSSLYNIIAQKEIKLSFQMAREQRKLAHASKRDSSTMKIISLLGSLFLPGAYLASIFSTTFFNFQNAPDIPLAVSPNFWLYWAVTVPITLLVVGIWYCWEKKREARYDREDADLERGSEDMEKISWQR